MRKHIYACIIAGAVLLGGGSALGADPVLLEDVTCPMGLGSCTANEVQTFVLDAVPVDNDSCTSEFDTIDVVLTLGLASNSDRYDFSVFVAQDGGKLNSAQGQSATAADCVGAVSQVGDGEGPFFIDLESDLGIDTCGDVPTIPEETPLEWKVRTTVDCVQSTEGEFLRIEACRTWTQNRLPGCTDLSDAGTGSKCDCTALEVTQIPVPSDPCEGNTCDDGLFCNGTETCNEETGACVAGNPPACSDDLFCNGTETCDEDTDSCVAGNPPVCDDGLFCNGTESCNEGTDSCDDGTAPICDDDLFCNGTETCNEDNDSCDDGTAPICDDGLFCNGTETCNEDNDSCDDGTAPICDDGLFCNGTETCNEDTDSCDSAGNPCDADAIPECDGSVACDELDDECVCATDICRTAGFWGTHEYVTDSLLTSANMDMSIEVCGVDVFDYSCGAEVLCSRARGNKQITAARQLLATALGCHITNGSADCAGTGIEELFASCNEACANDDSSAIRNCIPMLDCHNNGGQMIEGVGCALGTCSVDQDLCGDDAGDCAYVDNGEGGNANTCVSFGGNCHDAPLVNDLLGLYFDPPGPANGEACNDALRSRADLFDERVCPQM